MTGHGPQLVLHEMRIVGQIIGRLQRLPKPTIAAVDGVAVGVALGIALACDLVIATDRARFMEIFVKRGPRARRGYVLDSSAPRRSATGQTDRVLRRHRRRRDRVEWGLINEVVDPEALAETAAAWGRRLATGPTTALSLMKSQIDASSTSTFAEAMEDEARAQHIVYTTKDMQEGITAYLERREPHFTGE